MTRVMWFSLIIGMGCGWSCLACRADGVIGVRLQNLSAGQGVRVEEVMANGPAQLSGLQAGETLVAIDGQTVRTVGEALPLIRRHTPGTTVRLTLIANGQTRVLDVKVLPAGTEFKPPPVPAEIQDALDELADTYSEVVRDDRRPLGPVVRVKLNADRVSDASLRCLTALQEIEAVSLTDDRYQSNKRFPNSGFAELAKLPKLRTLRLTGKRITDAILANLADLKALEVLHLEETAVTDEGLKSLLTIKTLKDLSLRHADITDAGLAHLAALTNLEKLDLYRTKVAGPGLTHLAALSKLQLLDLDRTAIQDEQLSGLASLVHLTWLDMSRTAISDAGLVHLRGLTKLEALALSGCGRVVKAPPSTGTESDALLGSVANEFDPDSPVASPKRLTITVEGVEQQLSTFKALRHLELVGYEFEPSAVRRLGRMWPDTRILTSGKNLGPEERPNPFAPLKPEQ